MTSDAQKSRSANELLPPELKERFLDLAQTIRARKGQTVITASDPSADVYFIAEGRAQVSLHSIDGKEAIFRDIPTGGLFGEMSAIDGLPRSASVTALTDCLLARMSSEKFHEFLAGNAEAGIWLSGLLVSRIRDMTERGLELATMPVTQRIQSELLRMAHQTGSQEDEVYIDDFPTHAEFAARIGTHREAVSRELGWLAERGIVKKGKRRLKIISMAALSHLSSTL